MRACALLLCALWACTEKVEPEPVDNDGDGWSEADDCDDDDASVYPDAPEICADGIPNGCGRTEEEATALCEWSGDVDLRDAPLTLLGVDQNDYAGEGIVADFNGDGALDVAVGAWGDTAGGDLAGSVFVMFGGGSFVTSPAELGVEAAEVVIAGDGEKAYAGRALAAADVDGDGGTDLLIGSQGESDAAGGVHLFRSAGVLNEGDDDRWTYEAELNLAGLAADDLLGSDVAMLPDADGDGYPELAMGASLAADADAGAAYVVWSSVAATGEGDLAISAADVALSGVEAKDRAGAAIAGIADLDGDGLGDLAVGAPKGSPDGVEVGVVYLLYGGGETGSLADADVLMVGAAEDDQAGTAVADAGDVDGDGLSDVIVGSPGATGEAETSGTASLVHGSAVVSSGGRLGLELASVTLLGAATGDATGGSVAGAADVDGDGLADLAVGALGVDVNEDGQGAAWLLRSSGSLNGVVGTLSLTSADARFFGHDESTEAGGPVSFAPDLNGDGSPELMIGATGADVAANNAGAIFVLMHPGY